VHRAEEIDGNISPPVTEPTKIEALVEHSLRKEALKTASPVCEGKAA